MNILKRIWNFFFGFSGRIGRLHFAISWLFIFVIGLFITGFTNFAILPAMRGVKRGDYSVILIILSLLIIHSCLKYSHIARRTHDFGKYFWDSNLASTIALCEIIYIVLSIFARNTDVGYILMFISAIIGGICFISLIFVKGTQGKNHFGEEPIPFWKKQSVTQQQE